MGIRKRERVSPRLQFYAHLPDDDEPEYKSGFDCDACGEGFAVGPFYHCTITGVDRCMRCSVRSGIHPAPPTVVEIFVRLRNAEAVANELSADFVDVPSSRPLLAYRTCDRDVGILLSDGSCLLLETTPYSISKGWLRSANGEVEMIDDGADVASRYPWVEEWGNPHTLNDSNLFVARRWGRLPSKTSVEWKHVVFVKRWDVSSRGAHSGVGSGCDVLTTTDASGNEYMANLDRAHQCYSVWWMTGGHRKSSTNKLSTPAAGMWTLLQGRSPEPNHIMTFWEQSLLRGLQTISNSNFFFVDPLTELQSGVAIKPE